LGAGDRERAQSLAFHGVIIAIAFGAIFTLGMWIGGAALYRAMGADDAALSSALAYSHVLFAGAVAVWITALLSSALRGAGEVRVPARITLAGAGALLLLSPALIFGIGPFPRLEMAGAGVAVCVYFTLAALVLIAFMRSARSPLRLRAHRLEWRNVREIMSVGLLSAVGTVQANLTVALVTAAVGQYAADAIAGYGIGSRLDYLLIPLLFGFGTGVVTLVGREIGAGRPERALRVAWTGAALAGGTTGIIGLLAAIFAPAWARLFTSDASVIATTTLYLRTVAPFYAVFGFAMTLYFAGQGARRVGWPIFAGTVRLVVAGGLGTLAASLLHWPVAGVFALVAASIVLFGAITVGALLLKPWGRAAAQRTRAAAIANARSVARRSAVQTQQHCAQCALQEASSRWTAVSR
jgi:putative MATE family efflux protein